MGPQQEQKWVSGLGFGSFWPSLCGKAYLWATPSWYSHPWSIKFAKAELFLFLYHWYLHKTNKSSISGKFLAHLLYLSDSSRAHFHHIGYFVYVCLFFCQSLWQLETEKLHRNPGKILLIYLHRRGKHKTCQNKSPRRITQSKRTWLQAKWLGLSTEPQIRQKIMRKSQRKSPIIPVTQRSTCWKIVST